MQSIQNSWAPELHGRLSFAARPVTTAFVLGGGGVLGAVEVGMVRALLERGIAPDLILGTSVGALNGAFVARDPSLAVTGRLVDLWSAASQVRDVYGDRPLATMRRVVSSRTHIYSSDRLRSRLADEFGATTLEELPVRFQVCAASIERAAEHWFETGSVVDTVLASAAVPGLLPPAKVGEEHFLDGGIVNSIPLGRAVRLGASRIFVLQVGRIDRPLTPPQNPLEVARVSFEIARRHRFNRELSEVPPGVDVHVLPAAGTSSRDDSMFAYRDFSAVRDKMDATYDATRRYLADSGLGKLDQRGALDQQETRDQHGGGAQ
jgi:NTE family protein